MPAPVARIVGASSRSARVVRFVILAILVSFLLQPSSGLIGWLVGLAPQLRHWWPALFAALLTLSLIVASWQLRLRRLAAIAAVVLTGGVAGPLAGLTASDSFALDYAVLAATLMVSGALTLRRYLRRYPVVVVE